MYKKTSVWSKLLIAGLAVSSPIFQAQTLAGPVADRYIIQVNAGADPRAVAGAHGLAPDFVYTTAIKGFAGFVPPGRLQALQKDPRVSVVVQDRTVSAVAKLSGAGPAPGQIVPAGVQRIGAAPGGLSYHGDGVGVAVVDTGLDLNHADLQPLGSASFSAYGGTPQDGDGHGTHVGGIIAARNNTIGVVGVAPNATLYAVRVLDNNGSGTDATVMAGLDWVAANGAVVSPPIRVVNMSLGRAGSLDDNPALRASVQSVVNSGITVVVAAGNDCGLEVSQQVPATYPEVIAVASTTAKDGAKNRFGYGIAQDTASYFTTDGNLVNGIGVTISAPGEDAEDVNNGYLIKSVGILSTKLGGGTTRLSGTSMASPHVAGVVALLYQQAGGALLPEQARAKIIAGANNSSAPLDSPTSCYSFDGDREGILFAPGALAAP